MSVIYYTVSGIIAAVVGFVCFVVFTVNGFNDTDLFLGGWLCIALSMGYEYKADKAEEGR